jgi:hypothetical protein
MTWSPNQRSVGVTCTVGWLLVSGMVRAVNASAHALEWMFSPPAQAFPVNAAIFVELTDGCSRADGVGLGGHAGVRVCELCPSGNDGMSSPSTSLRRRVGRRRVPKTLGGR